MGQVYAGTSGWAYSSWKPDFYPQKLGSAKFLSHYASRLNSVEVNYTFRAFPTEKLLGGWIAATPEGFRFAMKANQKITHVKRLRETGELTRDFLNALRPLEEAGKLGPVLFQLPPFLKCDPALLRDFVGELPRRARCALEFRHDSWFAEEIYSILRDANVALCLAESDKLKTPDVATADFFYLRLRNEEYSAKERKQATHKAADLAKQGDVFVYFKHEDTPEGALHAEALLAASKGF